MNENLKKYLAEMLGTAVLVLTACGVAVFTGADVVATALAFGLAVVAMAYSIGNISGCHINPAVSLGALICKKINAKDFWCYVLFQIVGAIIGGAILFAIVKLSGIDPVGNMGANGYAAANTVANQIILSLIVEIALTFIFVFTVLGVVSKEKFSALAGIVIGLTLVLVHLIGINLTGTSVNPARSIGVAIFGGQRAIDELFVFIVAPLIGAALAGIAAKYMFKSEVKQSKDAK